MKRFVEKIKKYFLELAPPEAVFQLTSHALYGVRLAPKERTVKHFCVLPLKPGAILPSFDRANIPEPAAVESKIEEAKRLLHLQEGPVACLLPELCFKVTLFSVDSLPLSPQEREKIVWWRVKKIMPLLPDDTRLSFDTFKSQESEKVLASLARSSVIREYEEIFARKRLKVETATLPTLNLLHLLNQTQRAGEDALLANIEEDSVGLLAIINSEIVLYRVKPFLPEGRWQISPEDKLETVLKEMENTLHFIEDREKKKINALWIRQGQTDAQADWMAVFREKLPLSVQSVESLVPLDMPSREKQLLSPLVGQFL